MTIFVLRSWQPSIPCVVGVRPLDRQAYALYGWMAHAAGRPSKFYAWTKVTVSPSGHRAKALPWHSFADLLDWSCASQRRSLRRE